MEVEDAHVTATEMARNFKGMLNRVEFGREELVIVRNNHQVARVIPGPATMNALEAMGDIYRSLPEEAGYNWLADSRVEDGEEELRDPWRYRSTPVSGSTSKGGS